MTIKIFIYSFIILFAFFCDVMPQKYITGEQSGVLGPGEYIVTGTIYILNGRTLKIAPGTVLYFEQFSGITVLGSLISNGTPDSMIILTSIRDKKSNLPHPVKPESFDWNGLEISQEAKYVEIRNTKIRHSTFGINIKSAKTPITLDMVEFYDNGYASLFRDGKMVEVQQNIPFKISWNVGGEQDNEKTDRLIIRQDDGRTISSNKAQKEKELSKNETRKSNNNVKKTTKIIVGVTSGTLLVTGATLFTLETILYSKYKDLYNIQTTPQGAITYRNKMQSANSWRWVGMSIAGVGVLGLGITFLF